MSKQKRKPSSPLSFYRSIPFEFVVPRSLDQCIYRFEEIKKWGLSLSDSRSPDVQLDMLPDQSYEFRIVAYKDEKFNPKTNAHTRFIELHGTLSELRDGSTYVSGQAFSDRRWIYLLGALFLALINIFALLFVPFIFLEDRLMARQVRLNAIEPLRQALSS
jgi:hypothetical protein